MSLLSDGKSYSITLTNNSGVLYKERLTNNSVQIGDTLMFQVTGTALKDSIMSNAAQHNVLRGRTEIVANAVALGGSSGGSSGGTADYPSFTGNANKVLTVNTAEDGVEWTTAVTQVYVDTQDSLLQDQIDSKADAMATSQSLALKADLISGLIPASQLPSYVDDVLNFPDLASFPSLGEDGKIYIAEDVNKTYRWGGSSYVEIGGGGVALGETSSTAYRGDRGKVAYDHSLSQGNPHNTTTSDINEGTKLFFTESRVNQTVLTGLNTNTASPALATDNLLAAIGKLQAQITNSNSSGFNWVNATEISGFSFRSGVSTNPTQPLKFAIKDGLLWMSGSVYAGTLNAASEIFTLTNSNYQLEQPATPHTVTLSYFPAFYVKTGGFPDESQIEFKLIKQSSTLKMFPTTNNTISLGVFLVVFKTVCIGRLVS